MGRGTVINNIKIHDKSKEYLKTVFDCYEETDKLNRSLTGRTIIHMYPMEDTYDENGELNGIIDSLNCRLHIYNVPEKTVYKTTCLHDQVSIDVPCSIKLFKDMSTMITIDRDISILDGKSFIIIEGGFYK